ncbi:MAG TPA: hypothetical protein VFB38_17175, partial [Chthonomonadaceae bacterium]|nr:hypothetical protein [Chthonomonadaceae bacterium]
MNGKMLASGYRTVLLLVTVLLGLLQRQALAQTPPPLDQTASPSGIGILSGLDTKTPAPAHPAEDGHLVVTAARTQALALPGTIVEIVPALPLPGFETAMIAVEIDGQEQARQIVDPTSPLPVVRVPPPTGEVGRKRVRVVLFNHFKEPAESSQCVIRARMHASVQMTAQLQGEQLRLAIADRASLQGVYVFEGATYLGRLEDNTEQALLDARTLLPGSHRFWVVAETAEGVLLPPISQMVKIEPRYRISLPAQTGPILVPQDNPDKKLSVKVERAEGVGIAKTRLLVDGTIVGESEEAVIQMEVPLRNVPSGPTTIEVIGIGKDGHLYPSESLPIEVQNKAWEAHVANTLVLNDKYPSWSATIRFPVASFSGWCDFCCLLLALRLLHTVTGQVQLQ